MIMNASDNSLSSNSGQHLGLPLALNNQPVPRVELNLFVGRVLTVFGPAAPPLMQFTRLFEKILPAMYSGKIPLSLDVSPFSMLQGSWSLAAGQNCAQEAMQISDEILSSLDGNWPSVQPLPVARALVFTDSESDTATSAAISPGTPIPLKEKRVRKTKTPVVQPVNRRFTRSCLNQDGFRPQPLLSVQPKIKKKTRAKMLLVEKDKGQFSKSAKKKELTDGKNSPVHSDDEVEIPDTPIAVMQQVGSALGIDPTKMTKEQLEAVPEKVAPKNKKDD
jgi:hypothetical protein